MFSKNFFPTVGLTKKKYLADVTANIEVYNRPATREATRNLVQKRVDDLLSKALTIMFTIGISILFINEVFTEFCERNRLYYDEIENVQYRYGIKTNNWSTWIRFIQIFSSVCTSVTLSSILFSWLWVAEIKIARYGSRYSTGSEVEKFPGHEMFMVVTVGGIVYSLFGIWISIYILGHMCCVDRSVSLYNYVYKYNRIFAALLIIILFVVLTVCQIFLLQRMALEIFQ